MAKASGGVHRRFSPENFEISDRPCLEKQEFHVLAVDDSFVDRKVIERLLKISCCRVTVVESGKRALQFLGLDEEQSSVRSKGLKVNLIITDYSMPEMTGYELLKRIKESSSFKDVPVVIMSSENILTRIDRCLEEGAKEYIIKPVKLSDVKRLKDFIIKDQSNGVTQINGSCKPSLHQIKLQSNNDLSSPSSISSTSSSRIIHSVFTCSSPKCNCNCIARRPRFPNRSSEYQSELSLY